MEDPVYNVQPCCVCTPITWGSLPWRYWTWGQFRVLIKCMSHNLALCLPVFSTLITLWIAGTRKIQSVLFCGDTFPQCDSEHINGRLYWRNNHCYPPWLVSAVYRSFVVRNCLDRTQFTVYILFYAGLLILRLVEDGYQSILIITLYIECCFFDTLFFTSSRGRNFEDIDL